MPSWNFLGIETVEGKLKNITTTKLEFRRPPGIEVIKTSLERSMQQVRSIDGSIDPKWDSKVSAFVDGCERFLCRLETKKEREIYLLKSNSKLSMSVTLSVTNDGTSPASDIRVNATVPDALILAEKWPEGSDVPVAPKVPVPEAPRIGLGFGEAAALLGRNSFLQRDLLTNLHSLNAKTRGFYLEGNMLIFWADKLLHKHTVVPTDRIYILAKHDCKPGKYEIVCRIFCVEYDDWEEHLLSIEIKE